MNDQDLHMLCVQYGEWCRTRRFFAPPIPMSLLARFQPRPYSSQQPDAEMHPEMPFFNMAVHVLADLEPESSVCFLLYYLHGVRPVKTIAANLGIGRRTFYDRLHRHARRVKALSRKIKDAHSM